MVISYGTKHPAIHLTPAIILGAERCEPLISVTDQATIAKIQQPPAYENDQIFSPPNEAF